MGKLAEIEKLVQKYEDEYLRPTLSRSLTENLQNLSAFYDRVKSILDMDGE